MNTEYWADRRARLMYELIEEAEKTAGRVRAGYNDAQRQIQREARKVFEAFALKHGLTVAQAEALLKKAKDVEELKALLALDPTNQALLLELQSVPYTARIDNLAKLMKTVDTIVMGLATTEALITTGLYEVLARQSYYHGIFDIQQYAGYGWQIEHLSDEKIKKVLSINWTGRDFKTTIWGNTEAVAEAVKHEMLVSLLTGRPLRQTRQAIEAAFNKGMFNSRRLVRTESTFVANQLQLQAMKDAGANKYVYVATLDLKTSKLCQEHDKKVYDIDAAKVGDNYPPLHPFCRSTVIAYMGDALLKRMKQRALDPQTGKKVIVSGDMTYNQWFNKFVKEAENESKN